MSKIYTSLEEKIDWIEGVIGAYKRDGIFYRKIEYTDPTYTTEKQEVEAQAMISE